MDHGKGIASESPVGIREHKKWTTNMNFWLLNVMIDEASMGNRINGSWMMHITQTSLNLYIIVD